MEVLDFPQNLFKNTCGVGIDIGRSLTKIAYTSNETDRIRIHLTTIPTRNHEGISTLLAETCEGKIAPDKHCQVFSCGLGDSELKENISKLHGLKFTDRDDIGRLVAGFIFLSQNLPWTNCVKPSAIDSVAQGAGMAAFHEMFAEFVPTNSNYQKSKFAELKKYREQPEQTEPSSVHFPVLLVCVGTNDVIIKVHEDGAYEVCDSEPIGGQTFEGLGSILTGGKSFTELCDLASKGNSRNVDMYAEGLEWNPYDKVYGVMKKADRDGLSLKAYSFGRVPVGEKDNLASEDITSSLVSMFAEIIAARTYMWATIHQIKQVFFTGGFPLANQLIQDEIQKFFALKKFISSVGHVCDCYFLKHGQHCASLGTLLLSMEN